MDNAINENSNRDSSSTMDVESIDIPENNQSDELDEVFTDEQRSIREKRLAQLLPHQYKKGQSGNLLGRYMGGKSGKERVKAKIANMTDDEFEEFLEGMNKYNIWEMGEGRAETKTDLNIKGELSLEVSEELAEKYGIIETKKETADTEPISDSEKSETI